MEKLKNLSFCLLLAFLAGGFHFSSAQIELSLKDKLRKKLVPGDTHEYEVSLQNGQFFFATIRAFEFDMIAEVYNPDGDKLEEFDDNGISGEFIRIYAEQTGKYKILISPYEREKESGTYTLEVKQLQTAATTKKGRVEELFGYWTSSDNEKLPGIAIALVKDGECIYQKEYGMANLEHDVPLSSKSVFDLASLAKQFTGMAIAMLIHQGKLSLEDDIRKYVPEVPNFGKKISIADLLYHRSGLRGIGGLLSIGNFGSNKTYGEQVTADVVLDAVKYQQDLNFPVGEEYSYSNTGYVMLAIAVERITKMSFRDWTQKHIFKPLGMTQSFANDNPDEIIRNRATAYYSTADGFQYRQENGMALIGSSAVYSTTDDLIKWVNNFDNPKIGGGEIFKMMEKGGTLKNGEAINYGFGLNLIDYKGLRMIEHSGYSHPGFQTLIARFPEQKFSMIILTNWGDVNPIDIVGKYILGIYLGEYIDPEKSTPKEEVPDPGPKSIQIPPQLLDDYSGAFEFNSNSIVRFQREGEQLMAEFEGLGKHVLKALSRAEFYFEALDFTITFNKNDAGPTKEAVVRRGEEIISVMPRVKEKKDSTPEMPDHMASYSGYYFSPELRVIYQILQKEEELFVSNPKSGDNLLQKDEEKKDTFHGANGFFSSLTFLRNKEQEIVGFKVSQGERTRNLRFEKWK